MNYEAIMPSKVRHDEFQLESIGTVTVSTISLPPWILDSRVKFETAVIWDAVSDQDDGYRIMHVGFSQATAEDVHQYWCDPTKLAELIHMAVTSKSN